MTDVRADNEGYRRFREAMQAGILTPGMVVTQNELCELIGLSLSPLRETLVLLEEFGLVEIKPRTGIRIVYPEVALIREAGIQVVRLRQIVAEMRQAVRSDRMIIGGAAGGHLMDLIGMGDRSV